MKLFQVIKNVNKDDTQKAVPEVPFQFWEFKHSLSQNHRITE